MVQNEKFMIIILSFSGILIEGKIYSLFHPTLKKCEKYRQTDRTLKKCEKFRQTDRVVGHVGLCCG